MSNKLDPKDLAYVQNLIRLNADEITMMNGMVYYQMLLTVQLQTYCILLVH